ncbi:MAG: DUF1592 domain-containing protein, partial [Deltaproteobacteria bacterium]|nr:DUF1592 domain-containing protein [Nannocystaceae bacterium]
MGPGTTSLPCSHEPARPLHAKIECKSRLGRCEPRSMRPVTTRGALALAVALALAACRESQDEPLRHVVDAAPLARLSNAQYQSSLRELFAPLEVPPVSLPAEVEGRGGFRNNVALATASAALAEAQQRAAMGVAAAVAPDLAALVGCDAEDSSCLRAIVDELAPRAWRRPLLASELAIMGEDADAWLASYGFGVAAQLTAQSMLLAPEFGYLPRIGEPGDGDTRALDPWELASRLSYFVWIGPPDEALRSRAANDQLGDHDALVGEVLRMLGDARARRAMAQFHRELFDFDEVGANAIDLDHHADAFPPFEDPEETGDYYWNEYIPQLRHEPDVFVAEHVLEGDGTLGALLTSNRAWVPSGTLQVAYGANVVRTGRSITWTTYDDAAALGAAYAEPEFAGEYVEVDLDPSQRAGLFTLASWLSATAGPRQPSPVRRGARLLDRLLCRELHPPGDVPPLEGGA